jgi:predicted phage-related endonuclease
VTPEERKAWLQIRHQNISSTESSALFGLNPYTTAFEIAVQKREKEAPDFAGDERMGWGTRLQTAIGMGISADYGVAIIQPQDYIKRPGKVQMGSSFDFQIVQVYGAPKDTILQDLFNDHGPGILEIKNVDSLEYKNKWSEEAPDHIELQLQHQLECIGNKWGCIAALVGGNRAEIITRLRDEAVGQAIVRKVNDFWSLLANNQMPPVTMPEDAEVLIKLYGFADPGKLFDGRADDKLRLWCEEYAKAAAAEKAAKSGKEVAHARILEIIGDAEKALVSGYSISAGMVAQCPVSYVRSAYRNFRLTAKKEPVSGKDKAA